MATFVYALSTLTCIACAYLLLRAFKRRGSRLLLWSGICFAGLAINNALATIDVSGPTHSWDLATIRVAVAVVSLSILAFGLTWESA